MLSLLLMAATLNSGAAATGTLLLDETFAGSSVTNPGFVPLNDACLTGASSAPPAGGSTLGPCTAHQTGPVPTIGDTPGWLQLTDSLRGATGGTLYNRALPGNGGLQVTFEQYQYGGTGADGISFFLIDGAAQLEKTGAYGGGLGYAQRGDEPGVADAYLGVGLDAYGNFAVDFEGRGTGCPAGQKPPSVYQVYDRPPNTVTLRGPGKGDTGYCYLAGTGNSTQIGTDPDGNKLYGSSLPGSLRDTTLAAAKRTVRVTVSEDTRPTVTVEIDFGSGFQQVLSKKMPQDAPRTYKFGWAASTGSDTDVHLIRNVEVRSVVPLAALNIVKQIDKTEAQPDVYEIGDTVPYQFVVTNAGTSTLTNVTVDDPKISGITCPRTTLTARGTPNSTMTCTASHTLTGAEVSGGKFVNTAKARGTSGGGAVTSNESKVSVPVSGGILHLSKKASAKTAKPGDVITYTVLAKNTGDQQLRAARFTDDLSRVLDDADLVGTPEADIGDATYTAPKLTWEGPLDAGQTATITYTVKVKSGGDRRLDNGVTSTTQGSNCRTPQDDPACRTTVTLGKGRLTLAKRADVTRVRPGATVTYRITATNTGDGPLEDASFTDDLTRDLDDARYLGDAKATAGKVTYRAPKLTWRGTLQPGRRAVVTYSLKVRRGGDGTLRNTVVTSEPATNCPSRACTSLVIRVPKHDKPVLSP